MVEKDTFDLSNISMSNPLLQPFNTPFEVPPFDLIKVDHYLEALKESIEMARKEINLIAQADELPTFKNTIEPLEAAGEYMSRASSILFNLNSAETNEAMQQIAQEASPLLTAFSNEINQNVPLFKRIQTLHDRKDELSLNTEERMLLDKTYKGFIRSGAGLDQTQKKRFGEVAIALSKLGLTFGENVLAETNSFELWIDNEADIDGLPRDAKMRAAKQAEEKGKKGKWLFTLQAPSYLPLIEHVHNRELREKMYRAFMSKACHGDQYDNKEVVAKIVALRLELAYLLGYETYADFILEERMAEKPEKVIDFLNKLLALALPKAKEEVKEIEAFMKELGAKHELQRWDWAYYSEKLRKKKYDLDDELTKPYFKLENVIEGVFNAAEKLYDIQFRPNEAIPKYHKDVMAYEVLNENGEVLSVFLADYFPRPGKRGGAWMTSFREQKKIANKRVIPHVSIVCNFTPSTDTTPSLLTFDEVKTLFHEFGHALHGMLANTTYGSLSGTSVYWDFVELPSQIFENWCYESECLDSFARHHETGEKIPAEYIERIKKSSTYHEAYATVRQISFGLMDMAFHHRKTSVEDVLQVEREALMSTDLFPEVEGTAMSTQFSHIFAGGYAAGYYSYKWAEVLDADAFSLFKEKGIFNKATASAFKEHILSKGGTEPPMELYKRFRGKEPALEPLLKRAGLISE
jgi:peptidyl-dipeptidase Dcp